MGSITLEGGEFGFVLRFSFHQFKLHCLSGFWQLEEHVWGGGEFESIARVPDCLSNLIVGRD